jgi:quercetin dioxygenase-like cupin family protein
MSTARSDGPAEHDRVRITTWTFEADGDRTGPHTHELAYVVVPVTGGTFTVTDQDGTVTEMVQVAGTPYVRPAGVSHDLVNASGGRAVFVEVELKD